MFSKLHSTCQEEQFGSILWNFEYKFISDIERQISVAWSKVLKSVLKTAFRVSWTTWLVVFSKFEVFSALWANLFRSYNYCIDFEQNKIVFWKKTFEGTLKTAIYGCSDFFGSFFPFFFLRRNFHFFLVFDLEFFGFWLVTFSIWTETFCALFLSKNDC